MKKTILSTIAALTISMTGAVAQQPQYPYQNPDLPVDERVDDLIARMTLEEKVSQMQNRSIAIPRLGVCAYEWWNEALHGVARIKEINTTSYPQAIGMAASFNAPLLEEVATAISDEGRAIFNKDLKEGATGNRYRGLTYWTPNINIFRDPRWGRGQETYGEDPYLTATMGMAMVRGLQGNDPFYLKSSACAKHYAVHSGPEYKRHVFDATTTPYDLWDTYLPAFKALVEEAKVTGVMGAYNRHEGVPCSGSTLLLDDILREDWGFEGYVTSDCGGIRDFFAHHRTHQTGVEAAAAAVLAGTDLECGDIYKNLTKSVEKGLITERQLNKALKHLFTIRMRLGMFDPAERNPYSTIGDDVLDCEAHKALALKMAHESMVLLKNNKKTLPLNPNKIKRIAVVGPNANDELMMQGNYFGYPSNIESVLEGIKAKFADAEVTYIEGCGVVEPLEGVTAEAVAAQAKRADVIIFAGGINANYEGEEKKGIYGTAEGFSRGDRETIGLPTIQLAMLKALKSTGRPVILANFSGSATSMEWERQNLDAIIQCWYSGQAGGTALADILAGDYNPSGRMPLTTYKSEADLPDFENYSMENRTYRYFGGEVCYPFGYGLSYTTFDYSDIEATSQIPTGESITLSAEVKNSGKRDGEEVVQLYVVHKSCEGRHPICALKGFQKITLKRGESKRVEFTLRPQDLALVDESGSTTERSGEIEIFIGGGQPRFAEGVSATSQITGEPYQIQ